MSYQSSKITLASLCERFRESLYEDNKFNDFLATIEVKTKVNREYIAYGIIGFLALYLAVGWGNDFLCNFIGFAYPAYASMKAIESPYKEDDTKWLIYWCVYALFGILEFFSHLIFFWIPFYSLSKCLFLLLLIDPGKNEGAYLIYYKLLRPLFLKYQDSVDEILNQAKDFAKDKFGKDLYEPIKADDDEKEDQDEEVQFDQNEDPEKEKIS